MQNLHRVNCIQKCLEEIFIFNRRVSSSHSSYCIVKYNSVITYTDKWRNADCHSRTNRLWHLSTVTNCICHLWDIIHLKMFLKHNRSFNYTGIQHFIFKGLIFLKGKITRELQVWKTENWHTILENCPVKIVEFSIFWLSSLHLNRVWSKKYRTRNRKYKWNFYRTSKMVR